MKQDAKDKVMQMIRDGASVYQYYLRGSIEVLLDDERVCIDYVFFSQLRESGFIDKVLRNCTNRDYDKYDLYQGGKQPTIKITDLRQAAIGKWVEYTPTSIKGRIKSWNEIWVFVVYACGDNWDDYRNYTAAATDPKDVIFCDEPHEKQNKEKNNEES